MMNSQFFNKKIKYIFFVFILLFLFKTNIVYGGFNGAAGSIGGTSACGGSSTTYCWTYAYKYPDDTPGGFFTGLRVSIIDSSGNLINSYIENYVVSKNSWQDANNSAYAINVMARNSGHTLYYGTGNVLGSAYMVNTKISGDLFNSSILFGDVPGTGSFFGGNAANFLDWLKSGTYASGGGLTNIQKMIEGTGYPCLTNPASNPGLCGNISNHYVLVEPVILFHRGSVFWLFTAYEAAKYLSADSSGVGLGTYFKQLFNLFHLQYNLGSLIQGEGGSGENCGSWSQCVSKIAGASSPRSGYGVVAYNVASLGGYSCEQVLGIIDTEHDYSWNDYRDVTQNLYYAIKNGTVFSDNGVNYGIVSSSCTSNDCKGLLVSEPDNWTTSCTDMPNTAPSTSTGALSCNNSFQQIAENYTYPNVRISTSKGQVSYTCLETLKTRFYGNPIKTVSGHVLPLYLDTNGLFAESKAQISCSYSARVKMGSNAEIRISESYNNLLANQSSIINGIYNRNKLGVEFIAPRLGSVDSSAYMLNTNTHVAGTLSSNYSAENCETYDTEDGPVTYCTLKVTFSADDTIKLNYDNKWSFENGVYGSAVITSSNYIKESVYGIPIDLKTTSGIHNVKINHTFGSIYTNMVETNCSYVVEDYTCEDNGTICEDTPEEIVSKGKPNYNFEGMKLMFRLIDTDNPFVSVDGNVRDTGTNWCYGKIYNSETGIITSGPTTSCAYNNPVVIANITNRNNSYSTGEPLYTITLKSEDIQKIRVYNDSHSYSDYEMICDSNGERCLSKFISNLNNITGNTTLTGKCGYSRLPDVWSEAMFNCL